MKMAICYSLTARHDVLFLQEQVVKRELLGPQDPGVKRVTWEILAHRGYQVAMEKMVILGLNFIFILLQYNLCKIQL